MWNKKASASETCMFSFLFPSCKSLSGKGRGSIQHVTIMYLAVRSTGWSADQADHGVVRVCICVGCKTKRDATHISWKWFLRFGLAPCKHDWIGLVPQHMAENKCGWIYPHKYPEDAVMVYRAGTSYTATMKWVECGKGFDSLCQKNISVPVKDT